MAETQTEKHEKEIIRDRKKLEIRDKEKEKDV